MSKHSDEIKQKALAMAEAATIREASEETGVPAGTIKYWRSQNRKEESSNPNQPTQPNQVSKKIKQISEEATEQAKQEIAKHITQKGKKFAEKLIDSAEEARKAMLEAIRQGKTPEEYNANWVKALTGAMNYCIKTKNELTGEGEGKGGVNVNVHNTSIQQQTSPEEKRNRLMRRIDSIASAKTERNGDPGGNGDIWDR